MPLPFAQLQSPLLPLPSIVISSEVQRRLIKPDLKTYFRRPKENKEIRGLPCLLLFPTLVN